MNFLEFKKYMKELALLALPMLMGNLGHMLINLGDVFVSGHYSTNSLASISVASALFMSMIIPGIGLISGITPVLSNYRGERKFTKKYFGASIIFSQILALLFFIILMSMLPLAYKIGLNEEIISDTVTYLKISAYSIFGIFLFVAIKEYLQAHEVVMLPNLLMLGAVVLNLGLNFLFVFKFDMGTMGLAVASLIVRLVMGFVLLAYCFKLFKTSIYKDILFYIKELVKMGVPIAGAAFIEFLGFNIVAVLTGRFEPFYAACHNIIISIVSLTYMVPFSLSNALAVKVGYANGKKNLSDIKKYTLYSVIFIFLYAMIVGIIYIFGAEFIIKIFSNDPIVIKTGSSIMVIVAAFALFDGLQGVFTGSLKGMKHTKTIFMVIALSYLLISIPLGLILAYKFNLVLKGFWLGLAFALFAASIISCALFILRYFKLKKKIIAEQII